MRVLEVPSYAVFETAAARDAAIPSPKRGQAVLLLSTGELLVYYGALVRWRPPWNTAWGELGTASLNTQTTVPVPMSVVINAVPNRKYVAEFEGFVSCDVDKGVVGVALHAWDPLHGLSVWAPPGKATNTQSAVFLFDTVVSPARLVLRFGAVNAGSVTVDLVTYVNNASAGNGYLGVLPCVLSVNDAGPSGPPIF